MTLRFDDLIMKKIYNTSLSKKHEISSEKSYADANLTYEDVSTLLYQIEACLNQYH